MSALPPAPTELRSFLLRSFLLRSFLLRSSLLRSSLLRLSVTLALTSLLLTPLALAALLPGNFIIRKTTEPWKGVPSLVLERRIQGLDVNAEPGLERLTLQAGKVRREVNRQVQLYPPLPPVPGALRMAAALTSSTGAPTEANSAQAEPTSQNPDALEPPLLFDALLLQTGKQLVEWLREQGIGIEQVTLVRQLTPDAPLPFRVLFRLGDDRPASSWLDVEKEKFLLRRLQLRQPDGSTWLAEYDGYGLQAELPDWLPQKVSFSRGGLLVETRTVLRRLPLPVDDAVFNTLEPLVPLPTPEPAPAANAAESGPESAAPASPPAAPASPPAAPASPPSAAAPGP